MDGSAFRVLVVDDNPADARLVEYTLTHEPGAAFTCVRAGRISAALAQLESSEVDAVLLDLGLPDSQGTDGLRRIREKAPRVPVIVLTGSENPALVRTAIATGAHDYLIKGIFPKGYLARVLRSVVGRMEVETRLGEGRLPDAPLLEELSGEGVGVAILAPENALVANEAFTDLTGSPGASGEQIPAWLAELANGDPPSADRVPASGPGPSTIERRAGTMALERPDHLPIEVEYVVQRFPRTRVTLVYMRPASSHRPERELSDAPAVRPAAAPPPASGGPRRDPAVGSKGVEGPLDAATWENLKELAGTDSTFLPALVSAFLGEAHRLLGSLQSTVDAADLPALTRVAHTLKSSCAQVGALALSRRCAVLEERAEVDGVTEARRRVLEIAREFAGVESALRARYPRT
jgi:CheY-like chemotaxis protein/HPt (histidine-containing phosphotransfer) domain-containing protein